MTAPLLEVRNLTKTFAVRTPGFARKPRTLVAVNDVSFTLEAGETLGLVGESGCGKSTLGRTVLRLLEPDSGEVLLNGERLAADAPMLRRKMQIVFQDPYSALPPKMRIGRALAEPLLIHRIVPREQIADRVAQLLVDVGLKSEHAEVFPRQLSGGQRQRVCIARALAVEPSLIVADEAVSALDVSVQAQILNLLKDLQERRGIAYLFISHDLGVVRYVSHRIAVMYLGRIVEQGQASDVVRAPLHPYTRGLLSSVPRLEATSGTLRIEAQPPDPVAPPPGCAFHPRCPVAEPVCAEERPELLQWPTSRQAACHFALEDPGQPSVATGKPAPTSGGST